MPSCCGVCRLTGVPDIDYALIDFASCLADETKPRSNILLPGLRGHSHSAASAWAMIQAHLSQITRRWLSSAPCPDQYSRSIFATVAVREAH